MDYLYSLAMNRTIALEVWSLMYQHILTIHRIRGEWIFVHYDQLFDERILAKLEQVTGAPLDRSFPEKSLKRSQPDFVPPPEIMALYDQLCGLAEF